MENSDLLKVNGVMNPFSSLSFSMISHITVSNSCLIVLILLVFDKIYVEMQ